MTPAAAAAAAKFSAPLVVARGEVAVGAAAHRVDQVVGDVGALQGRAQRLGLEHVGAHDLAAGGLQILGAVGMAGERADLRPFLAQPLAQQPADIAGRAGDGDHADHLPDEAENQP